MSPDHVDASVPIRGIHTAATGPTPPPLRRGWTTGACAAAAAKAAVIGLATGSAPPEVTIVLPKGRTTTMKIDRDHPTQPEGWFAEVTKDAGDDPDVTHGARIGVIAAAGPAGTGITFHAGPGVGTVTKPGLPLSVGEPAINPVPRQYIAHNAAEAAAQHELPLDLALTICVVDGAELATHTWNPRLGILGGISILGTTGVVIPYSCSAWIDSIRRGVDVAAAAGLTTVVGATGSTSEQAAMDYLGLPLESFIDMGDFVGALTKYLHRRHMTRLIIAGGFAKLTKLACGHMDLHSARSQVDLVQLATWARELGASPDVVVRIESSPTALGALQECQAHGIPISEDVATRAKLAVVAALPQQTLADVIVVSRAGTVLASTIEPNTLR